MILGDPSVFEQQRRIIDLRSHDGSGHEGVAEGQVRATGCLHHLADVVRNVDVLEDDRGTDRPDRRAGTGMAAGGRMTRQDDVRVLIERGCSVVGICVVVMDLPPVFGRVIGRECDGPIFGTGRPDFALDVDIRAGGSRGNSVHSDQCTRLDEKGMSDRHQHVARHMDHAAPGIGTRRIVERTGNGRDEGVGQVRQ